MFGAVTWLGMPAEPFLNVWLKILLWPAGLVDSVLGGPSSGWAVAALAKFMSLVGVGAFFAYLFFSLRLNAGLAVIAFSLSSGMSWWVWASYWPTWSTSPPPLWMAIFVWPGKLVGAALHDVGAGGISHRELSTSALTAMSSMTGLLYATIICGVRTFFRALTGQPAPSGDGAPSPSAPD